VRSLGKPCAALRPSIVRIHEALTYIVKIDKNEECGDGGEESDDQDEGAHKKTISDQDPEALEEIRTMPALRHAKTALSGPRLK